MNPDQALSQVRPIISIIGGLLKFFGLNVPISGSGLEIAVAGWLTKAI